MKKGRWKVLHLWLAFFTLSILYSNCAPSFKADVLEKNSQASTNQGGDGVPFEPLPTTTTTTTTSSTSTTSSSTTTSSTMSSTTTTTTLPPVTLKSCTQGQHQLPLATHWNASTKTFQEGAAGAFLMFNADSSSNYVFNQSFLPNTDQYLGDTYAVYQYNDLDVKTWADQLCQRNGIAIEFKKPISYSNWSMARQAAASRPGSLQIIPALIIRKSLVNIILPPDWNSSAPKGTYPILFNGFYDAHDGLRIEGQNSIAALSNLWKAQQRGAIAIHWNGGGALSSRTTTEESLHQFNEVIQAVADFFGGDPQRIIAFGVSRGGVTSLRVSSNPLRLPYRVLATFSAVPPNQLGEVAYLTSTTIPQLFYAAEWSIGFKDIWKSLWKYPSAGNDLTGLNVFEAHLKVLTGNGNRETVNAQHSLSSSRFLMGLQESQTEVYLQIGSHDFIVPWIDQWRYALKLETMNIPLDLRINYGAGHFRDDIELEAQLSESLKKVSQGQNQNLISRGRKRFFRLNSQTKSLESTPQRLFTIEFPRRIYKGLPALLIAVGSPGTIYRINYTLDGQNPQSPFEQTLNASGESIVNLETLEGKQIEIKTLEIKKNNEPWKMIPLSQSTTRLPNDRLLIDIQSENIPVRGTDLTIQTMESYLGIDNSLAIDAKFIGVSYGLFE
jgi:hypothetical protein